MEPLEQILLYAVGSFVYDSATGRLTITDTSGNDSYELRQESNQLRLYDNGTIARSIGASYIKQIEVKLTGGTWNKFLAADTVQAPISATGSAGVDEITGGAGNDVLRGGGGGDTLNGRAGDDVIFGEGSGIDTLTGGSGKDRLLLEAGDKVSGSDSQDAEILFKTGTTGSTAGKDWSANEILRFDRLGFAPLQQALGNTRLLKGPGGNKLVFERFESLQNGAPADNIPASTTIRITDELMNDTDSFVRETIIHEVGHVFDEPADLAGNTKFQTMVSDFRGISGWVDNPSQTTGLTASNAPNDKWYYRSTAANTFVSTYAKKNPYEDFADSFVIWVYSRNGYSLPSEFAAPGNLLTTVNGKSKSSVFDTYFLALSSSV